MADLLSSIAAHSDKSDDDIKKAGKPAGDDMAAAHKTYLADLIAKLDTKIIDPYAPSSLVDQTKYAALTELDRGKVDLMAVNMASQIQRIERFYRDKSIPDASPELQTMIDHLWSAKKTLESQYGPLLRF
jgi:hypothetical protein